MSSTTFKNLKPERQEEILQTAYEEFALKGYQNASLTEIIKKLGLAKGSFYRYFKSKKALFAYLIEDSKTRRLSKLDKLIFQEEIDFFFLIKQNFLDKIEFDKQHPVIGGFLYQVMHERDNSEVSELIRNMYDEVIAQTRYIISLDKFKNQLNVFDAEMLAFQIFNMQLWLYDYVTYKYKVNFEENIRNRKPVLDLPGEKLEELIDWSVSMLRDGIKAKK